MFIKVCGITTTEQIDWAVTLGYTAIGLVIYKKSKRYISTEICKQFADYAKGKIKTVAVSMDYADLSPVEKSVDYVQFYTGTGYEHLATSKIILAGSTIPESKIYKYFLYDISHGSGEFSQFPKHIKVIKEKLIIAGGLSSDNIKQVIDQYEPVGVDISSGVESGQGIKDYNKMKKFIENCKSQ